MAEPGAQGASRVVLLARAGKAADNLADAVRQAGAELLLCVDPANTDETALRALSPQAVLVALEPSIEPALDRLDALLVDPGLSVIFDEADVAAHRSGWEAARWVRHLSAKLRRDDNVLPPGTESDAQWQPSPGQVPKPAAAYADVDMTLFTQEAVANAASVPADGDPVPTVPAVAATAALAAAVAPEVVAPVVERPVPPPLPPSAAVQAPEPAPAREPTFDPFIDPAIDLAILDAIPASPAIATPAPAAPPVAMPPPLPVADAPRNEPGLLDDVMRELAMLQQNAAAPAPAGPPPLPAFEHLSLEPIAFEAPAPTPSSPLSDLDFDAAAFDEISIEPMPLEPLSSDAGSMSAPLSSPAALQDADNAIAPMQFDDDAFFLQELSASGDAASTESLSFEGIELETLTFDDEPEQPSTFVPRDPEPVMSLEELIASNTVQPDVAPAAPTASAPAVPAASPPPLPSAETATGGGSAGFSFGDLSLAPVDDAAPVAAAAAAAKPAHDISALEARISGLSLLGIEDDEKPASGMFGLELPGIVLIEAGLGGPDPARQLLSAIPAAFPAVVLVRLHLQGGRYDRLVAQMERASALPVALAESGATANPGSIYFLPEGLGVAVNGAKLRFVVEEGDSRSVFATLPANNSAVIFLSGADPKLVDVAMAAAATGTVVAAQTPEDCYDGVACTELRTRGAASGLPAELAGRLATRWPSY